MVDVHCAGAVDSYENRAPSAASVRCMSDLHPLPMVRGFAMCLYQSSTWLCRRWWILCKTYWICIVRFSLPFNGAAGANLEYVLFVHEIVGATDARLREASSPRPGSKATSALSHGHLCTRAWRNKHLTAALLPKR